MREDIRPSSASVSVSSWAPNLELKQPKPLRQQVLVVRSKLPPLRSATFMTENRPAAPGPERVPNTTTSAVDDDEDFSVEDANKFRSRDRQRWRRWSGGWI